jgi:hypothetical protein
MGSDIADINNDGLMDIYTLDMLPEDNRRQKQLFGSDRYDVYAAMVKSGLHSQYMRNMLHLNNGDGTFSEIGQLAGVANTDWSWSALIADYDNDGIQDLFVSNGFKRDLTDNDFAKFKAQEEIILARKSGKKKSFLEVIDKFTENKIPNYIFQGNGDLTFTKRSVEWGIDEPSLTNGAAYGDLDNDGDLDLVLNNINEHAGIYRNNSETLLKNNYLQVHLSGKDQNTFALGAKVSLFTGDQKIVRELLPVRGFQSSVDPVLHFGLGSIEQIDSLHIRWPTGEFQVLKNVTANQKLQIKEEEGKTIPQRLSPATTYFLKKENVIDFTYRENNFTDFHVQALLPRMYSTQGPAMASADVNNDGLSDIFVGGAKGQAGELFIQDKNGNYKRTWQALLAQHSEDVAAAFFDMDNDGDRDLYVVSGGYEYAVNDKYLEDHLYENDGKGNFRSKGLPSFLSSGSCVRPSDVDSDGDTDLFVGGRIIPGRYPEKPESYMLLNDGKGNFSIDSALSPQLKLAGMVTDAVWVDLNKDKQEDLIVVGEWMPIRVFINSNGKFTDHSARYVKTKTEGLWNCIIAEDFDGDGDKDFVAGNYGLNSQMKVSAEKPATLVYSDFDNNGSVDPLLSYFIMDRSYPYPTRDELSEQLPSFKKRFTDYKSYSDASIEDVLSKQEVASAEKLIAYRCETAYIRNDTDSFEVVPMPVALQFAPVFSLAVMDVNQDGKADIVSGGNLSATRARTGKLTGNYGFVFLGDGKGSFDFVPPVKTGMYTKGDVRNIIIDRDRIIVGANNLPIQTYELR